MMRKYLAAVLALVCVLMFTACGNAAVQGDSSNFGFQLEAPAEGEDVAVMHTNYGDIYIRLFPEQAPKTVENFTTLAKDGYYDGLTFHRVINDFMIQGGDPTGTGTGGESCWGEDFADEFHAELGNLYGSLAMANAGANTNGSQFFINQASASSESSLANFKRTYENHKNDQLAAYGSFREFIAEYYGVSASALTDKVLETYEEVGGNFYLDGPLRTDGAGHTVFGQVFNGMEVVETIAALETDVNDKPLTEVRIESIEFVPFTADMMA